MLKKVILCPNPYRDHELTVAKEAKRILDSVHCPNVVCVPFRNEEKPEGYGLDIRPLQQELRGADMIIAFGGDGTILHLSKTAAHRDIPVLGVNLGSLGFMAELEQKELGRLGELMDEKIHGREPHDARRQRGARGARHLLQPCAQRGGRDPWSGVPRDPAPHSGPSRDGCSM